MTRRAQRSWAMYDWANSAYATTVIAGFFPLFFNQYWAAGVAPTTATFYLGLGNSVASLIVMVLAPWLGTMADRLGAKKRFLLGFTMLGVAATAALAGVGKGNWPAAIALFALGSVGFFGGLSFYDSLLVSVSRAEESDRVSSLGYGLGYLGGGLLFGLNVAMVLMPQKFGFSGAVDATRASFVTVAAWWALFSVPLFRNVPEGPRAVGEPAQGWRELWQTLHRLRRMPQVWTFLLAYWLYIDGVNTIIDLAVDFGLKLGLKSQSLITALLMVQFIGFPAAVAYGRLAGKIGTRPAIFTALVVYGGVTCWGYVLSTEAQFFVMAGVIGCVQGGIQALSRSYYSRLVPRDKAGEFFGFYNMLGKFAAVLGPLMVGGTAALTGNPRAAILTLLVLFVAGGVLLARVREGVGEPGAMPG